MPRWIATLLGIPLIGKIAGANAIIVVAAVLVAYFGHMVDAGSGLWLVLLSALGLGMAVNAVLVYVALRPLQELENTARRVWQGHLDSRVPGSLVTDAGIQRVGNTLNILLDGLSADQARLRYLANQVIQAGDRERASLARELHDSTAQTLAALLLELSVLAGQNTDPNLDERITRVRGLGAALQLLARESVQRSNVLVTYAGPAKVEPLDAPSASALYRIAQEAVGNAIRHARAHSVAVRLRENASVMELEVADDGIGFVPDEVERRRSGMGLFTMRERAALVGGRLSLTSANGKGTRVIAQVPRVAASPTPTVGVGSGAGTSWRGTRDV
jgi:signal transduction histidine kinase